ncbi:MAG TPA: pyrimidine-nucleoside phosphorylase, partial [Anaerolineae bacterium]|nr:pyrimidine-nucleoside phosphorylase [Anaerolineae bacterium]
IPLGVDLSDMDCLVVGGEMLALGGKAADALVGRELVAQAIESGAAWQKFRQMVIAQGGDVRYLDEPERFPVARIVRPVPAPVNGYLARVQTDEIGMTTVALGGGRLQKGDPIDHSVGLMMHLKVGEWIHAGEPLFTVYANDEARCAEAERRVLAALTFSETPVDPLPLFYKRVG